MMHRTVYAVIAVVLLNALFPVTAAAQRHVFAVLSDISIRPDDRFAAESLENCIRDINSCDSICFVIVTGRVFPDCMDLVSEMLDELHCRYFMADDKNTSHIYEDDIWDVYFDYCGAVAVDSNGFRRLAFCGCCSRSMCLKYYAGGPLLLCRPLLSDDKQPGYTLVRMNRGHVLFSEKIVFSSTTAEMSPWFEVSF